MNLCLVKELGDRAAQGRAYGNLGNTHYLLGNFVEAIKFHRQVRNPRHLPASYSHCCSAEISGSSGPLTAALGYVSGLYTSCILPEAPVDLSLLCFYYTQPRSKQVGTTAFCGWLWWKTCVNRLSYYRQYMLLQKDSKSSNFNLCRSKHNVFSKTISSLVWLKFSMQNNKTPHLVWDGRGPDSNLNSYRFSHSTLSICIKSNFCLFQTNWRDVWQRVEGQGE